MNLLQPVQILQTGMKFMFDLDPTITEQLYHHSMSQMTLLTAVGIQLMKTLISRLPRKIDGGQSPLRFLHMTRQSFFR